MGRIVVGRQGRKCRDIPDSVPGMPRTKTLRKAPFSVVQQTGVYPYPLGAGSARPNPKDGAPDTENPFVHRIYCAQRGMETMVSDHGLGRGQLHTWGSEIVIFFSLFSYRSPSPRPHPDPAQHPATDLKQTRNRTEMDPNGAESDPNGPEMDRNQALWGGMAGGFVGMGGLGVVKEKEITTQKMFMQENVGLFFRSSLLLLMPRDFGTRKLSHIPSGQQFFTGRFFLNKLFLCSDA